MKTKQPEALRLAHIFEHPLPPDWDEMVAATKELRRLHAENEALRKRECLHQIAEPAPSSAAEYPPLPKCKYAASGDIKDFGWFSTHQMLSYVAAERELRGVANSAPVDADVQRDAERYRWLRDGDWRDTDIEPIIRLQLNTLWDAKIDAAIEAAHGIT